MADAGDSTTASDVRDPGPFDQLRTLEQQSRRIYYNQPLFLPGVLQVAGYAAAMIGGIVGLKAGDPELKQRVEVRMQRARAFDQRLRGSDPPEVWLPIDEAVLRRAVGGAAVMREQLDRLAAVSNMDTVRLAIIPLSSGAHAGLGGSFEVHEVDGGEASVFFESEHRDEILGADSRLAQQCRDKVMTMMGSAVTGPAAQELLKTISSAM